MKIYIYIIERKKITKHTNTHIHIEKLNHSPKNSKVFEGVVCNLIK